MDEGATPQAVIAPQSAPFLRTLGLGALEVDAGNATAHLDFDPARHANGIGIAHGGVLCTLLDIVMGYAAFSWPGRPGPIVTVNQNVSFLGTMRGPVIARGRVVRGGRSMVFCAAEVLDEGGECIAAGQGVFKKLPSAPASPHGQGRQGGTRPPCRVTSS